MAMVCLLLQLLSISWWQTNWEYPSHIYSLMYKTTFIGMGSNTFHIGQPIFKWLTIQVPYELYCYSQLVNIHSKCYHRSGEKAAGVYLNRLYIKAWQFESDMWVCKVLIASTSRFYPFCCQCQNPAELALQDVLLRWKPAVSCSSTGSRFWCFGSVASKSRGAHIFCRIRVA